MIHTPQLWLPDRLRQRREDERLLRGRGGLSRRWMPGQPCCCEEDKTCLRVILSDVDYTPGCYVYAASYPFYMTCEGFLADRSTDRVWNLPETSASGNNRAWQFEWDELDNEITYTAQLLYDNYVRLTIYYHTEVGGFVQYRTITFSKDLSGLGHGGLLTGGEVTIPYVSEFGPVSFSVPDFTGASATVKLIATTPCAPPLIPYARFCEIPCDALLVELVNTFDDHYNIPDMDGFYSLTPVQPRVCSYETDDLRILAEYRCVATASGVCGLGWEIQIVVDVDGVRSTLHWQDAAGYGYWTATDCSCDRTQHPGVSTSLPDWEIYYECVTLPEMEQGWVALHGQSSLAAKGGTTNDTYAELTNKSKLVAVGGMTNITSANLMSGSYLNAMGGEPPE